jgi:tRNA (mo5U34)-methyltransferase
MAVRQQGKSADPSGVQLAEEVAAIDWYHTLELAPGIVTPGWLDTRPVVNSIPFPSSLAGKRCLDVGTFNGFWAFEMERRGAQDVIGIDVLEPGEWDWPAGSDPATIAAVGQRQAGGAGFEIAKRELDSSVRRLDLSVYDLEEDQVGRFDVVYIGSLLVHLRDPVKALEQVRAVCSDMLIVVDGIDPFLSLTFPRQPVAALDGRGRPWWWYSNVAGLARMIEAAGFELTQQPRRLNIPAGPGRPGTRLHPRALRTREGRYRLYVAWRGDPHAVVVARPRV